MELGTPLLALMLGLSAGLRSMMPLAVLSAALYFEKLGAGGYASYLATLPAFLVLSVGALGELIADKTPWVPNRTSLLPLIGRAFSGGFAAFTIASITRGNLAIAVIIGIAAAAAGAFGGYAIRRHLTNERGVPDMPIAIVEDGVSISLAVSACFLAA